MCLPASGGSSRGKICCRNSASGSMIISRSVLNNFFHRRVEELEFKSSLLEMTRTCRITRGIGLDNICTIRFYDGGNFVLPLNHQSVMSNTAQFNGRGRVRATSQRQSVTSNDPCPNGDNPLLGIIARSVAKVILQIWKRNGFALLAMTIGALIQ